MSLWAPSLLASKNPGGPSVGKGQDAALSADSQIVAVTLTLTLTF